MKVLWNIVTVLLMCGYVHMGVLEYQYQKETFKKKWPSSTWKCSDRNHAIFGSTMWPITWPILLSMNAEDTASSW